MQRCNEPLCFRCISDATVVCSQKKTGGSSLREVILNGADLSQSVSCGCQNFSLMRHAVVHAALHLHTRDGRSHFEGCQGKCRSFAVLWACERRIWTAVLLEARHLQVDNWCCQYFAHAGALTSRVPEEETFIVCYSPPDCNTVMLPLESSHLSVIAGHIPVTELQRAGLKHASCMVSVRDPVDRAISCLHYFFPKEMEGVEHMSDSEFYRIATERTLCNNAAAYMLASGTAAISEREANTIHRNASASKAVAASAIKNLERCVVISLSDVTDGQPWGQWVPVFLAHWFPWMHAPEIIPHMRRNDKASPLPHRHMKVLEDLNTADTEIYEHAVKVMVRQKDLLSAILPPSQVQLRAGVGHQPDADKKS